MTIAVDLGRKATKTNKQVRNFKFNMFLSLKIVFILANSVDPDEMPHTVAFHLGLHCLPKYLFMQSRASCF